MAYSMGHGMQTFNALYAKASPSERRKPVETAILRHLFPPHPDGTDSPLVAKVLPLLVDQTWEEVHTLLGALQVWLQQMQ